MTDSGRPPTNDAEEPSKIDRGYAHLIALGLAGVSLAAVIELTSMSVLDWALWVALYCFAVAIPVNTAYGMFVHPDSGVAAAVFVRRRLNAVYLVGALAAFIGFIGLFGHFSWSLSAVFGVSAVLVVLIMSHLTGDYAEVRTRVRERLRKVGL